MNPQSCLKLINTRWKIHPSMCCQYPVLVTDEFAELCSGTCFNNSDTCCMDYCFYKDTGIYVDGTFDSSKIVEPFITYAKSKSLNADWNPIVTTAVAESVNDCKFLDDFYFSFFLSRSFL